MQISILIPAYNEEKTIGKVVMDFKKQLPESKIYVCDNNSGDKTAEIAEKTGAHILRENRLGKGYALQKLLTIKSDIYVVVDGDDTYPAEKVKNLIQPITENKADMAIASRKRFNSGIVRNFGNFFVTTLLNLFFNRNPTPTVIDWGIARSLRLLGRISENTNIPATSIADSHHQLKTDGIFVFKHKLHDALSGYRAFNYNLIKNLNQKSKGFEIETELTIKAIESNFRIIEIPVNYTARKESKLRAYKDGIRIILALITLFIYYHPIKFFSIIAITSVIAGLVFGVQI